MTDTIQQSAVVLFDTMRADNGKLIGLATLNSEKSLNALSLPMVELLLPQLQAWKDDPHVAMVVLQGAGDKAFCAGGDIRDLYHNMQQQPGVFQPYVTEFFTKEYHLDYLIHTFDKPVLVCCNTGATANKAVAALRKAGRDQVFNLAGGLQAWRQAGLPVQR